MEVPPFPAARPLLITDKQFMDPLLSLLQLRISEATFACIYLFRTAHSYRLTRIGSTLVVLGRRNDGESYFLPPLSSDPMQACQALLEQGLTLYGVDESYAAQHLHDMQLQMSEDRDNFDYLYSKTDLAELPGGRYHKKKNRINYFSNRHQWRCDRYQAVDQAECLDFLAQWRQIRTESKHPGLAHEVDAAAEALTLVEQLCLEGLVIRVEGAVKAFVLGERLNSTTAVCHFEKADPFLDGLYQLVDREFCRQLFLDCTLVNREQDLGETNLRAAKLSYHPLELVRKLRIRSKGP